MTTIDQLFTNNETWASQLRQQNPDFFENLSKQQQPEYLWIGCSDSRVPANEIIGLAPGELFVHRNIANVVVHTDLNALSVIQFAVDVLKVKHIIVCGHYGCSGVLTTLRGERIGLSDNWLRHIDDVLHKHHSLLEPISDETDRCNRLCEFNVIEQVLNVCKTTIVRDAWDRDQEVTVHGWIYGTRDGLLKDLRCSIASVNDVKNSYGKAISMISEA
ncbi:MAG: carbonic anhydrase [Verrucomicrobia bacterium RIFCSPHIGHO2_12_FULL_41_10]|nr:MAG: carbonic anhydrase [Verrucomicrobia bacterium RIFCSPHIGHO2_12_FULL_41_10]HLB34529.1 carbonate dehydratase [Chthoniobacterales bacterium]